MSSDDGIRLRQLPDGKWVGYRYSASAEENEVTIIREILTERGRYPRYASLEDAHQAYRDVAAKTEYGFDIVWYHVTSGMPNEETQELIDLSKIAPTTLPLNDLVDSSEKSFGQELTKLINRYSKENKSGTPDFILARFLERQLWIFGETIEQRASWRGESIELRSNLTEVATTPRSQIDRLVDGEKMEP